jgi:aldose 1-epimerase
VNDDDEPAVELSLRSPDGDQGFPGAVDVTAIYTLSARNELIVSYRATCDAPTHVNLTLHAYWNLGGRGSGDVGEHEVTINASRFLPVDASLIPTGERREAAGSVFDFTHGRRAGAARLSDDEQLRLGGGYDHCFILDDGGTAARVVDPASGRWLEIETTEPGMQFYMGQGLAEPNSGLALETQHFPNSPNEPSFPTTLLRPGELYASKSVYRFG